LQSYRETIGWNTIGGCSLTADISIWDGSWKIARRFSVQVGDLVRVKAGKTPFPVGVITDTMETDDGWNHFEVIYTIEGRQEREWLSDLQMETINEGR
jgi:hypothetical protein